MLELVRHHGEELVLQRIGALQLGTQLLLVFEQRLALRLHQLAVGQVAGDLGVAVQAAIVERRRDAAAEEQAAVLAQLPALVFGAALFAGPPQLVGRHAGGAVLRREDGVERVPHHLGLEIAEHPLGAFVPCRHPALGVERDDRVVARAFGDQPHVQLSEPHLVFGAPRRADVDEGQHRAVDAVMRGPVRQYPHEVALVVRPANLALDQA